MENNRTIKPETAHTIIMKRSGNIHYAPDFHATSQLINQTLEHMDGYISNNLNAVKEGFYIDGIKNLRKKVNFLQLNFHLQSGFITEAEFESEVNANPNKYIIDVRMLDNPIEFKILQEVVSTIDSTLTYDEVLEIFSVDFYSKGSIEKID
jgi:hypothetical protein